MNFNPALPVYEQCQRTPDALALYADGVELSYGELLHQFSRLSHALLSRGLGRNSRIGILASRSQLAIVSVLAASCCGATYVPLGLRWPEDRIRQVLALSPLDAIVIDEEAACLLSPDILSGINLIIVSNDVIATTIPADKNRILNLESVTAASSMITPAVLSADDLLYVIFTSGTTGVPKGVMVACGSVAVYLDALGERKKLVPGDRASQFTELSFDPSLGEIFLPLRSGASLHVVPSVNTMSPVRFIRERELTVWGSTPAAIAWMRSTRALQPGKLSSLRYSSFGGEPLPLASVHTWQAAAPNSQIDNLYGPTEATVDCVGQLLDPGETPSVDPDRGILAIGVPHPGTELMILDSDRRELTCQEVGELAIAGGQLAVGYLDAPEVTAERYPVLDGKRWYLTGDLAYRDESGLFHHRGRIDNQVKVHGHRVELDDIEAHMRDLAGHVQVAAVAWPKVDGVATGVIGFFVKCDLSGSQMRAALRKRLPAYMVPSVVHEIASIPLNNAGKLDRKALIDDIEARKAKR